MHDLLLASLGGPTEYPPQTVARRTGAAARDGNNDVRRHAES
ncbi:MAG TPA: hypothetical protein VK501_15950 [Baekduia sp.]|nr:hypothetical protein [Baekduia sp.]HMJ35402.1 hypothetical protein [Baekduia sp.]